MSEKQVLDTLNHTSYALSYHIIFVTKYRRKTLTDKVKERLEAVLDETLEKWDCELLEFGGEADHAHLLVKANPKVQPSKLVNNLKTVSSRLLRKEFDLPLPLWSRSYCILSTGGAPLEVIRQYIESQ